MYIPQAFVSGPESGPPPTREPIPNRMDTLSHSVTCGLCGTPIRTVQELEVVASSAVHGECLRHMLFMGWQLANDLTPDNSV
jgi:hypothetical protein